MLRKLFGYIWGVIVHPKATFDELAQLTSIRYAVMAIVLVYLLQYLNYLLFTAFGYDWLGTRRELSDPTFVGFFGRISIRVEDYVPVFFFVMMPLMILLGPVIVPGLAQMLSKIWHGQGTFEQMVNALGFAQAPAALFAVLINDMILGSVPTNLIAGHPYAFTAAMNGEFGAVWSTLIWAYMFGIYIFGMGVWTIVLGTMAIHRVQRIPWWAAALVMTFSYILGFYGIGGMVAR